MSEAETNATPEPVAVTESPAGSSAETSTDSSAGTTAESAGTKPRRGPLGPLVVIVAAIGAIFVSGLAWYQTGQLRQDLQGYRQGVLGSFENTTGDMRLLADTITDLQDVLTEREARIESLEADLQALSAQQAAANRRVDELQGGRLDARDSWLREQIEYYLVLANAELTVRREPGRAIAALELADDVLLELGDPRLGDVRRAISSGLQALRALPEPDTEGLVLDIAALQAAIPQLPLRAAGPDNFVTQVEEGDDDPGFARLWDRTRGAVTSIVRIEREDGPVELTLTETERRIVRRQLELELQVARAAVTDRRDADFRASLVAADGILQRDFERDARSVIAAREALARLAEVRLAPPLPDISDSLVLFRSAAGAR